MIIAPYERIDNPILYRSNHGFVHTDDCWRKSRYGVSDKGDVRCEDLRIYPKENYMIKECSTGKMMQSKAIYSNAVNIKNYMYSTIDLDTGNMVQWGCDSTIPSTTGAHGYEFVGMFGVPHPSIENIDNLDNVYKTNSVDVSDFGFTYERKLSNIYTIEDYLQIGFTKVVGMINSYFTQWGFAYPFDSYVILDSKTGTFNIPQFKYLSILSDNAIKNIYAKYAKGISKLATLLKYNCDKECRHIRIMVYTTAYCSIVKIKDIDHGEISLDMPLSASDHFESIIDNVVSDGNKYGISEEANCLHNTPYENVSDEMLDTCQYIDDIKNNRF